MNIKLLQGDCIEILKTLSDASVDCVVTSPPYFGLRDYGVDGQIGVERTPEEYVEKLCVVFREVKRVLRIEGTMWLNLGDSYAGSGKGRNSDGTHSVGGKQDTNIGSNEGVGFKTETPDCKPKDLIGIPWRVAFALQADGWYLRQDIIWNKPNPMPESVTDRCTKAHEYVFLFSKNGKYYFDQESIKEPITQSTIERLSQPNIENQKGSDRVHGKTNGNMKAVGRGGKNSFRGQGANRDGRCMKDIGTDATRNKRSVWTVNTRPYKEAHFATFPPDLIKPMILAGCPLGGTVLDPFGGSGTTGEVAESLGRNSILIELNPKYIQIQRRRTAQQFFEV